MSLTAQQLVNRSLRLLGRISSGDTPSTNESSDGLISLNAMISSWLADRDFGAVTLIEYTALSTSQTLPNGYEEAIAFNLAVRLAAEYTIPAPAEVIETAKVAFAFIRRAAAPAIGTTAQKIVNRALRLIEQIGPDEISTATESAYVLDALRSMIDSWQTERLSVLTMQEETLTLSATVASYTIGPSGVLNTVRPVEISGGYILDSGSSYPVNPMDVNEYIGLSAKTTAGSWPDKMYYKADYPLGTLYVYPVPNATRTLKLLTRVPLTSFSALSTTIALAPGYERALVYNLAVDIAPEFGKSAAPEVVATARQSKASIKIVNSRPIRADNELAALFPTRSGNILTGD